MAARNLFQSGFWHGKDIERKEAVSAIFPDNNLTQNYVITVKQRETFARLLKYIQEQIQNHLKNVYLDMHGLNQFWTKKWNSSGLILSSQNFLVLMANL